MKLNKNEQNYLLTILFKSYILQSVICSGIILVCTVSLDMGLTWVLDRYVEHYYLIYRGLYVYMVIFEQFYRVDTSRNTTSGGAGLGLAIAKHIVELHKGTIVAHSKDECIKFIVTLPLS